MENTSLKSPEKVTGVYVNNNESTPVICETYGVIYTDGTFGEEFFNGNMWLVNYKHPVAYWLNKTVPNPTNQT